MLSHHERRFLSAQRVGHLATADGRAIPHVVPVCFAIWQGTLYITIDEKPKRVAGAVLKRVRNIERNPMVAIISRADRNRPTPTETRGSGVSQIVSRARRVISAKASMLGSLPLPRPSPRTITEERRLTAEP